jgi:hypothetical protein
VCLLALTALIAGAAGSATAAEPVAMHVGGDVRKMTREVCARKAVEAMGVREKFPFAEVTEDGNARGWNGSTSVLVLSFPTPAADNIQILVIAAGKDDEEVGRVRNAVRAHIFDGPYDPDAPKRVGPASGALPPRAVCLCWKSEERSAVGPLRFFEPVASVVLEKQAFTTNIGGKNFVFGVFPGRSVATFVGSAATGVSARLNVVTATGDEDSGNKLATDLLARIVKVIYD